MASRSPRCASSTRRSDIQVQNIKARVELLPLLLLQRVRVPAAHISHVTVTVFADTDKNRKWDPHFLPPSLRIDAASTRIDKVVITAPSGYVSVFDNLVTSATVYPKQIRARTAEVDHLGMHFVASGRVLAAKPTGPSRGKPRSATGPKACRTGRSSAAPRATSTSWPSTRASSARSMPEVKGDALTLTSGWNFVGHSVVHDFDLAPFGGGRALGINLGRTGRDRRESRLHRARHADRARPQGRPPWP